jgi:formate dehydrogenase subunit delta
MQEIERLVKMANQIAENFSFHEDAVARIADHLQRFWAPSMREKLIEASREEALEMNPAVREAVRRLETG